MRVPPVVAECFHETAGPLFDARPFALQAKPGINIKPKSVIKPCMLEYCLNSILFGHLCVSVV